MNLSDIPEMPGGYERYQGLTLQEFAAAHPLLVASAIKNGGWELSEEARSVLYGTTPPIKRPSKHFA